MLDLEKMKNRKQEEDQFPTIDEDGVFDVIKKFVLYAMRVFSIESRTILIELDII